ncbi:DEAD/DEAH box helicase [Sphingomonas sp. CFBP 8764]|uniref:DEAD/DEAH box helicase n=1 Tax=Sphingomonas sp. CFBP 8764 TaxID=2775275 RepID=UPI00177EA82B|nr:SNF2-related protein [Sphingomonas sp. CFBP 8764]MBD8552556.1 DEAD/DEAH box helicase family protein [Sphingomonas sp. CFBP 8764]
MNELLRAASRDVATFLALHLPSLSPNWWDKLVLDRLSFQQERTARERGFTRLEQFDFAALLRIFDQNWFEISAKMPLPREARSWLKELQTVRNKWAHLSAADLPASEVYRDADTLGRLLEAIEASANTRREVGNAKLNALSLMASPRTEPAEKREPEPLAPPPGESSPEPGSTPSPPTLFRPGELVALRSEPASTLPVVEVLAGGSEPRYRVFRNNSTAVFYESQLQAAQSGPRRSEPVPAHELRARLTGLQILSGSTANLYSLRSGRVQFVPYQYRPVLKLIRADRPRLLIADEVGVGKTIEAGLIIKELRARMDISSVLVICPKALVAERKWFKEMKRFDEHFSELDGPTLRHCLQETDLEGNWPEQHAKAILPFSLFDSDLLLGSPAARGRRKVKGLLELDPAPRFDLVIVDEAHHIRNSETYLHQAVRYFCDNAQAVVLMTATPVQLGSQDLFTLLNVLRPDLVIDHASFDQMAEPNRPINAAIQYCRSADPDWQHLALAAMDEAATTQWGRLFLREAPAFQDAYDRLGGDALEDTQRIPIIRQIEELYTFSGMINRTRRRDIGQFTTRKPETVLVEFTDDQRRLHDGLLELVARILVKCHGQQNVRFMMTTIRRQAASCLYGLAPLLSDILAGKLDRLEALESADDDREVDLSFVGKVRRDMDELLALASSLSPHDPKVEAFKRVIAEKGGLANNKSLVFTTFRHTIAYLAQHAVQTGLRIGVVHGGIPDEDRADLRRRFSLPEVEAEAIDVLLSSEVGCEGLDFQFCDLLINYDLPWNPMRIEQRIGRIDRYGQRSETVAVVNLVTPGTVDADIYQRCLWRIGVFQHAVGGNEEILGEITREIHDIAESFTLSDDERQERLRQLSDNAIRQLQEEEDLESKQSELFGLNVPKPTWREDIEAAETFWLSSDAIADAVSTYLSQRLTSDAELLLGDKPLRTLRLAQEARNVLLADYAMLPRSGDPVAREWEKWLKGGQPTLAVTFDQETAAEHPRAAHLSVLHPLVRQAARFLDINEPQFCILETVTDQLPEGDHPFALYRWSKHGVRSDEELVAVVATPVVEAALLDLLATAHETNRRDLPPQAVFDALDELHHSKWAKAQAAHAETNRQLVEHRIQSLTVSHRARSQVIEDQIARAGNDKIRIMRQGELSRANADFDRRHAELELAVSGGDVRATPIVFGSIKFVGTAR